MLLPPSVYTCISYIEPRVPFGYMLWVNDWNELKIINIYIWCDPQTKNSTIQLLTKSWITVTWAGFGQWRWTGGCSSGSGGCGTTPSGGRCSCNSRTSLWRGPILWTSYRFLCRRRDTSGGRAGTGQAPGLLLTQIWPTLSGRCLLPGNTTLVRRVWTRCCCCMWSFWTGSWQFAPRPGRTSSMS